MSDRLTAERPIISMQSVSSVHAKRVEYPPIISKARPELLTVPAATDKRRVEGRSFRPLEFQKKNGNEPKREKTEPPPF